MKTPKTNPTKLSGLQGISSTVDQDICQLKTPLVISLSERKCCCYSLDSGLILDVVVSLLLQNFKKVLHLVDRHSSLLQHLLRYSA